MKSKKDNIAEYILYLWQMEDYLRAFPQNADATPELHELNEMMHREGIVDGGHLALANNALSELEDLHATILNEDAMYRAAIMRLQPSLNLLKAKTDRPTMSDIEACLLLLYQIMLLKLQKREITPETASVQTQATSVRCSNPARSPRRPLPSVRERRLKPFTRTATFTASGRHKKRRESPTTLGIGIFSSVCFSLF